MLHFYTKNKFSKLVSSTTTPKWGEVVVCNISVKRKFSFFMSFLCSFEFYFPGELDIISNSSINIPRTQLIELIKNFTDVSQKTNDFITDEMKRNANNKKTAEKADETSAASKKAAEKRRRAAAHEEARKNEKIKMEMENAAKEARKAAKILKKMLLELEKAELKKKNYNLQDYKKMILDYQNILNIKDVNVRARAFHLYEINKDILRYRSWRDDKGRRTPFLYDIWVPTERPGVSFGPFRIQTKLWPQLHFELHFDGWDDPKKLKRKKKEEKLQNLKRQKEEEEFLKEFFNGTHLKKYLEKRKKELKNEFKMSDSNEEIIFEFYENIEIDWTQFVMKFEKNSHNNKEEINQLPKDFF